MGYCGVTSGAQYDLDTNHGAGKDCAVKVVYKSLEDSVPFYEANKKDLKSELAAVITESSKLSLLPDKSRG